MLKVGDKILVITTHEKWSHIYPLGVQTVAKVDIDSEFLTTVLGSDYWFDQKFNSVSKWCYPTNLALMLWGFK